MINAQHTYNTYQTVCDKMEPQGVIQIVKQFISQQQLRHPSLYVVLHYVHMCVSAYIYSM